MNLRKYWFIRLSFLGIVFLSSILNATLYYQGHFDNELYKNLGYGEKIWIQAYSIAAIKLIDDPNKGPEPVILSIDANACRIVLDYYNSSNGLWITKEFGKYGNGTGNGEFAFPRSIVANSSGDIYVSDTGNSRIVKLKMKFEGNNLNIYFDRNVSGFGSDTGQLKYPEQISLDRNGSIYVCDTMNNRIVLFGSNGDYKKQFGTMGTQEGQFQYPRGVAVSLLNFIYVSDTGNNRIQKFDLDGKFISLIHSSDSIPLEISYGQLDTDINGNLYVVGLNNNVVYKFTDDLLYLVSNSGFPISPFANLYGVTIDKSYNTSGEWFSYGQVYTIEATRATIFEIGVDITDIYVSLPTFTSVDINFILTENCNYSVNIYDLENKLIKTLAENIYSAIGRVILNWDGKNNRDEYVPLGNYTIEIRAMDTYGHKKVIRYLPISYQQLIDTLGPSVPLLRWPSDGLHINKQGLAFMWNPSIDDLSGINRYEIEIMSYGQFITSHTQYNPEISLPEGKYLWRVKGCDNAGNYSDWSDTWSVIIDTTPPLITPLLIKIVPALHLKPFVFTINDTNIDIIFDIYDTFSSSIAVTLDMRNVDGIRIFSVMQPFDSTPNIFQTLTYHWDGKDIFGQFIPDGKYFYKIKATDKANNSSYWTDDAEVEIDRTPSYIKTLYTDRAIFYEGETITMFYVVSDSATVEVPILDGAGKVISSYAIADEKLPAQLYSFVWDGKDGAGNPVSDGSYILQVKTTDKVGNESSRSVGVIKNYIPAKITFPSDDYDSASGTVIIRGDALDPGTDNPRDFMWYKVWYSTSEVTTITDPKAPSPGIWYPVVVPAINQSPADPNFPDSNISYRAVTQDVLGCWMTGDLSADTICTLLLVTEDKSGNVSYATRKVTIGVSPASESMPAVSITSPIENDTFTLNTETATLKIEYNLTSGGAGTGVSLEIFRVANGNYTGIVRYEEFNIPYSAIPTINSYFWDGKDFRRWYVESDDYVIRLTAKDSDGFGTDSFIFV